MRWVDTVAILILPTLAGCGSEEDRIPLVRVTGTVTQNGKPLANANVAFFPDPANKYATPGVDETGPEGNYMVKFKGRTGVAAGKYKVVVTPSLEVESDASIPEEIRNDRMMMLTGQEARGLAAKKPGRGEEKKAPMKNEWDGQEVPDTSSAVLDFDVKRKG